jgi:hypothetical protein
MTEVFSFEVDFGATKIFCQTFSKEEGSGTTDKVLETIMKLLLKPAIPFGSKIRLFQFMNGRHEGFRNIHAPELPKSPVFIRICGHGTFCRNRIQKEKSIAMEPLTHKTN